MFSTSRQTVYLLIVLCVGQVLLISAQVGSKSGVPVLQSVAVGGVSRVQSTTSWFAGGISGTWSHYFALRGAAIENEQLRQRVVELQGQIQAQQAAVSRTQSLESALGLLQTAVPRMLAARVAISFQRLDKGAEIARELVGELPRAPRSAFLEEVGRWSEDAGAPALTVWALSQLREETSARDRGRALDQRIQRAALSGGDTTTAVAAGSRLADAFPSRSPERRRVLVDLIRIEARRASADALLARLETFRSEYPDAAEVDELAAMVASGLQQRGQGERAAEVIDRVEGPRSSLERRPFSGCSQPPSGVADPTGRPALTRNVYSRRSAARRAM